jgi:RNA-directed DNA polymerase
VGEQKPAGKPFDISKQEVQDAWLKVKANKGAPGVNTMELGGFNSAWLRDLVF